MLPRDTSDSSTSFLSSDTLQRGIAFYVSPELQREYSREPQAEQQLLDFICSCFVAAGKVRGLNKGMYRVLEGEGEGQDTGSLSLATSPGTMTTKHLNVVL